jgi:carbamoylphosphate synthase large subunit
MFLITWMFDKLGYMPKIDMQVGKVNIEAAWPFPGENKDFFAIEREKPKPRVKRTRALPSKATVAKTAARTARAKKAK